MEHCTGIAEVMGSNPVEASELFQLQKSLSLTCTYYSVGLGIELESSCKPAPGYIQYEGRFLVRNLTQTPSSLCTLYAAKLRVLNY